MTARCSVDDFYPLPDVPPERPPAEFARQPTRISMTSAHRSRNCPNALIISASNPIECAPPFKGDIIHGDAYRAPDEGNQSTPSNAHLARRPYSNVYDVPVVMSLL